MNRGARQGERLIDEAWFDAMDATPEGGESALLWWHMHEARIEVAAAHLEALERAGAPAEVTDRLAELQGVHASMYDFFWELQRVLGVDWRERLPDGTQPFSLELGRRIGYRAEGDLGQHVYVFPEEQLVAVRQVSESTVAKQEPALLELPTSKEEYLRRVGRFMFADFEKLLLELRAALTAAQD